MALTKVSGGILDPGINVAGIVTATGFDGPFTGGSSKNITAGVVTATSLDLNGNGDISGSLTVGSGGLDLNGSGDISGDLVIHGNLTANGDFTTLNTTLREVELLKVDAQNDNVAAGIITQRGTGNILDLYDTSSAVFSVRDGGNIIMGASAGSITPHAPLHIRTATTGAITTLLKLHGPFTSNTGSEGTAIDFGTASDTSTGARIIGTREAAGAKGALRFCTGRENDSGFNNGRMMIDENGNVGINQSSPEYKLVINEENTVGTAHTIIGASLNPIIYLDAGNEVDRSIIIKKHTTSNGAKIGGLIFASSPDASNYSWAGIKAIQDTNAAAESLVFYTSTSNTSGANSNEVLRIKGNTVGIGSATPLSAMALDVVGSIRYSNQLRGAAGSESEPSYAFYADHDSGMYRGGTNILSFATAGNNRLDIAADGTITVKNSLNVNTRATVGGASVGFTPQNSSWATAASLILKGNYGGGIAFNDNDNNGYSMYAEGNGQNFFIKNGAVGGSLKSSIKCIKDGGVILYHNDTQVAYIGQDALYVYGRTANSGMVEIASNQAANNNDRFRIHKTSAASRLTIQNFSSGSWENNILFNSDGEVSIPAGSNTTNRLTFGGAINIYHDGNTKFENGTGYLKLQSNNAVYIDGSALYFRNAGGTNRWLINSSGHLLPGAVGSYDIGSTSAEIGNVYIADDKRFYAGSDQNLSLYHNNTTGINYLVSNPGNMFYMSATNYFTDAAQSKIQAQFIHNSYCELRHAGNLKFRTSETGIDVTGEVATTQDYPNFRPTLDLNFVAEKKLDPRITYRRTGPASFTNEFGKVVLVGDNTPRFDHDPDTGESLGLLHEESRTNLAPYGNDMSQYNSVNMTVTANNEVAPDGTTTATKLEHGGGGTNWYLDYGISTVTASGAGTYTYSVWVKAPDDQPDDYYTCRIAILTSTGGNTEIALSLKKTWTRFSVTKTYASESGYIRIHPIIFRATPGSASDGKVVPSYIWVWGSQWEQGSFKTSYIPTNSEAATRGVDITQIEEDEFTEFYNSDEWTMITDTNVENSQSLVASPTGVNSINFEGDNNTKKFSTRYVTNSTVNQGYVDSIGSMSGTSYYDLVGGGVGNYNMKTAHAAKANDVAASFNGGTVQTDTSVTMLEGGSIMNIGQNPKQFHIKRIMYYPKRLPNSQLVTLTS